MNKQTLIGLYDYYQRNRRVGHTHSMLHGALNTNSVVVAHNESGADYIRSIVVSSPPIVVSLSQVTSGHVGMGYHLPMLIDNAAMCSILSLAISGLEKSERQQKVINDVMEKLKNV